MNGLKWSALALALGAALAVGWWSGRASAPAAPRLPTWRWHGKVAQKRH